MEAPLPAREGEGPSAGAVRRSEIEPTEPPAPARDEPTPPAREEPELEPHRATRRRRRRPATSKAKGESCLRAHPDLASLFSKWAVLRGQSRTRPNPTDRRLHMTRQWKLYTNYREVMDDMARCSWQIGTGRAKSTKGPVDSPLPGEQLAAGGV